MVSWTASVRTILGFCYEHFWIGVFCLAYWLPDYNMDMVTDPQGMQISIALLTFMKHYSGNCPITKFPLQVISNLLVIKFIVVIQILTEQPKLLWFMWTLLFQLEAMMEIWTGRREKDTHLHILFMELLAQRLQLTVSQEITR